MESATIFVVDDDRLMGESIVALITSMGGTARWLPSAEEFLSVYDGHSHGCVVSDLRLTGMNGLELQEQIRARDWTIPVILISAYPRSRSIVRAMQNGAISFLEKPLDDDVLWSTIRDAVAVHERRQQRADRIQELKERFAKLSEREREVLEMVVEGQKNKEIADSLDVSIRTVESRRRQIFDKTGTASLAELVRLYGEIHEGRQEVTVREV